MTLTNDRLHQEIEINERVTRNVAARDTAIATIGWLRDRLAALGWVRYREGELISPDGQCVIRTGYASGETEVQIKRPRVFTPARDITPAILRLHRGDVREMRLETEQFLWENTEYRL